MITIESTYGSHLNVGISKIESEGISVALKGHSHEQRATITEVVSRASPVPLTDGSM